MTGFKYKVGDKVDVVKDEYPTKCPVGTVCEVVMLGLELVYLNSPVGGNTDWGFHCDEIRPHFEVGKKYVRADGEAVECTVSRSFGEFPIRMDADSDYGGYWYWYSAEGVSCIGKDDARIVGTYAETVAAPTLWGDMTDAEKGALLLADCNGEKMQAYYCKNTWESKDNGCKYLDHKAYRVKPKVVATTTKFKWWMQDDVSGHQTSKTYEISIGITDGTPDPTSIKMVAL